MSKTFEALSAQQQEKEQQQKKQELKQELTTTTAMSPPTVPETPEELQAELARFREAAARNSRVSFLGKIGRFVKGDWLLGAEKEKIPDKTRWIGIMSRAQHGYIEWVDADDGTDKRVPVHHYLGRIGEGHAPPPRKPWQDGSIAMEDRAEQRTRRSIERSRVPAVAFTRRREGLASSR